MTNTFMTHELTTPPTLDSIDIIDFLASQHGYLEDTQALVERFERAVKDSATRVLIGRCVNGSVVSVQIEERQLGSA